jgi:DegV family protein with EDD domain
LMDTIRVVTDSTSDIPQDLAEALNIEVVPCYINFADESFLDQVELSRDDFYGRLVSSSIHPTTAAPPPGLFAEAYRRAIKTASGIVSIHPPDRLSALRQSAINGWNLLKSDIPYLALDAGQLSMGLGWVAVKAAQAAAEDATMNVIEELVASLYERVHLFAALDSVTYLQRSGRVGWARGAIGKLLRVRPLIKLFQGSVSSEGYVRTRKKAIEGLLSRVRRLGELGTLTVLHTNSPELAEQFRQSLAALPVPEPSLTINATPVLGTHVGPDAVGFVAIQT